MVAKPETHGSEIEIIERLNADLQRIEDENPGTLVFDAMKAILLSRDELEDIYCESPDPLARDKANHLIRKIDQIEEYVSRLSMVVDLQQDVITVNTEIVTALVMQRDELAQKAEDLQEAADLAYADGWHDGERAALAGVGLVDDDDAEGYDLDELEAIEDLNNESAIDGEDDITADQMGMLLELPEPERAPMLRWLAWLDALDKDSRAELYVGWTDEQRAWVDRWYINRGSNAA